MPHLPWTKEIKSPGSGAKMEPVAKRDSVIKAKEGWGEVRDKEIDTLAGDLSALYADKIEAVEELDAADDELGELDARVARGETLDATELARRTALQTTIVPGLRARLMKIEQQIRSTERTARRQFPRQFGDFL